MTSPNDDLIIPLDTQFMVVDDMNAMRMVVKKLLKELGYLKVCEAYHGKNALEVLEEQKAKGSPVQVISSDWNMPIMDGLALLKAVRAMPEYKALPFLMITAEGEVVNIKDAVLAGVSNYCVKPFSATQFKDKLIAAWKKHQPKKG